MRPRSVDISKTAVAIYVGDKFLNCCRKGWTEFNRIGEGEKKVYNFHAWIKQLGL